MDLKKYRGALLGLAAGDAVGTTLEFTQPGSFAPIDDMIGGGPFGLQAGQWTDDTSMALCLATSLVEKQGFDAVDQMARYVRWYRDGYLSSTGYCFDIGNTTRAALHRFEQTGDPMSGSTDPNAAGNGSIMRLAPVPLAFAANPDRAIELAGESSKTTHGAETAVSACRYMACIIVGLLHGAGKDEVLAKRYSPVEGFWEKRPLSPKIDAIAAGSFKGKTAAQVRGSGYVVHSLEAALWAFWASESFEEGCLLAVNLGDDADTTGAVYGQIAGAYYGEDGIPQRWRRKLTMHDTIVALADQLYALGGMQQ